MTAPPPDCDPTWTTGRERLHHAATQQLRPTPELARIQQIARQLRDPHYGQRSVTTIRNEEYLCAPPDSPPCTRP